MDDTRVSSERKAMPGADKISNIREWMGVYGVGFISALADRASVVIEIVAAGKFGGCI